MKHSAMYIISGIGALVLFVAFLFYTSAPVNLVGWFKLSDLLTIIGGLMLIIPFYIVSVRRKMRDNAPNPWAWQYLPVIGMVLMVIGLIFPNGKLTVGVIDLCDVLYLFGCVFMLMIFVYPFGSVNEEMLESDVDERVDDDARQ